MINFLRIFFSKVKENTHLSLVVKNTLWIFSDKIFKGTTGLIIGALFARYLGPERYGILNYAISFVLLIYVIGNLGLDNIVIREIVHEPERKEFLLGTAFNLNLIVGVVVFLLSPLLLSFLKPQDRLMMFLVAITAFGYIFQAFNVIDLWFQSQLQAKYSVVSGNIVSLLFFLIKIILVILKVPLIVLAIILTIEMIASNIGLMIIYRIQGFALRGWKFSSRVASGLLKDSWPLILSNIAIIIYMRIDQIMIGNIVGERELGIYSAAVRISEIWYFIPMAIFSSLYPKMIELRKNSQYLYFKRQQQLFNFMVRLGYGVAILAIFLSKPVVSLVFGSQYLQASSILSIHIWAGVFVGLAVSSEQFFLAGNFTRMLCYRTVLGAFFNIVLNLFLIPRYGGIGAAIATLTSQFIVGYFFDIFNYNTRKIFFMKTRSLFLIPGYTKFTKNLKRLESV